MQNSQTVSLHTRLKQLLVANRFSECESLARRRLNLNPSDSLTWKYFAEAIYRQGRVSEALAPAQRCAKLRPEDSYAVLLLAETFFVLEEWGEAITAFRVALNKLEKEPTAEFSVSQQAACFNKLGHALFNTGQLVPAHSAFLVASARNPQSTQAWFNLGVCLMELGEMQKAEAPFRNALTLDPSDVKHVTTLGVCLLSLERWAEAFELLQQAHLTSPEDGSIANNLGVAAQKTGRLDLAKRLMEFVVEKSPNSANAWVNLGNIYRDEKNLDEAMKNYETALNLDPENFSGLTSLAILNFHAQQLDQAEALLLKASRLPSISHPSFHEIYSDIGSILSTQARHAEAEVWYKKGLQTLPEKRMVWHKWLFAVNNNPFYSSEDIKSEFDKFSEAFEIDIVESNKKFFRRRGNKKLRIGYLSADFNTHSVRHFLFPLLRNHDRERFEIFAFTNMADPTDIWGRYKEVVNNWHSVYGLSDRQASSLIEEIGIDVLVDLSGHTAGNRLCIFPFRPAPVTVSWLGFGATTGLKSIDYYLTDSYIVPEKDAPYFSETPWRLERSAYAYLPAENMGDCGESPFVKNGYITFVNLSRVIRFNEVLINSWAEILRRVPDSVLKIDCKNVLDKKLAGRILADFESNGIERGRILLGYESPPWNTLRASDIYLDCFPHNSGTTLYESLYMGVPYITLSSRPGVGRIGGGILHAAGHPEWIAFSRDEYIEKSVSLARDKDQLRKIRKKLRFDIEASQIRDETGFARAVENAYVEMIDRFNSKIKEV